MLIASMILFSATYVNAQFTEQWVARYDGPAHSYDQATAIAVDGNSGNIYVTGWSDGGAVTGNDYATIAYDPLGNQLWVARYDGPAHGGDFARAIAVDVTSGNVYVTGDSYGAPPSAYDYATVAYDALGNQLWAARYRGPGAGGGARAIALDSLGNIYVTGQSDGGISTGEEYATVAYDPSGNQLWEARYNGGNNGNDGANAVTVDPSSGNVYLTGSSYAGPSVGYDYATVAYDSSGNQLWATRYDRPAHAGFYDTARGITVDPTSGNVYVTGESYGGAGTGYEYATLAYDASGNQLWEARHSGTGTSGAHANAIALAQTLGKASGNIYVTGRSYGGAATGDDYTTIAYDPLGNQLWVATYDGPAHTSDVAFAIAVDRLGNIYVTGESYRGFAMNDYATVAYDPSGNQLWVARYNGPSQPDQQEDNAAYAIAVDTSSKVYVTGRSYGGMPMLKHLYDYATIMYSQP